ncbi:hypothetical protein SCOR_27570 [Sulfidibacter corallicola]|uniref:DUF7450 domain-containing protein n=1 Tax=Sulfidibacter corallicola TaxID=2818388 RepID=A0A8A4TNA0_SULCO|nr:hypothetical protein [Sulfidibacter corallicola]QTD50684.1 hypothetical protein J3U87_34290 [Sulfidibacter corallicola]
MKTMLQVMFSVLFFLNVGPVWAQPFQLDEYLCYQVDPQRVGARVELFGQFDHDWQPVYVYEFYRFCNPAEVNGDPINDKFAHLSWYHFDPMGDPEPKRRVVVQNKFGTFDLTIGESFWLLVPTEKIEPGSEFPHRLDHYKVYEVLQGERVNKDVFIRDQFTSEGNVAMRPRYFAVPVEKLHDDKHFPINNPKDHIVFYDKDPITRNFYRPTVDQFGRKPMKTRVSELLGCASAKLFWEAY